MKKTILPILLLLPVIYLNAQLAFSNKGNLQIHNSASVTGFGDFTNTSTATLINNGSLYVKGTLTNDQASMSAGTGTLYLNGSSAQSVSGSQPFKSYNLNTNNSSGITLNNNLSVSNSHTFSAGIITSSATPNYLIYESGSSYSGDGDSKHVNGWVKKIGSTNFTFPVGDASYERTVTLSSLSGSSEFNAKYLTGTPNTAYSNMQYPLVMVDAFEYWSINKVSGGSASVTMNWDYSKVYFPNWIVPDIVAAGYNGSLWTSNGGSASGTPTATGTVTSNSVSSFNLFTFGSVSWILPVALTDFKAIRYNGYTNIQWTIDKEFNIDHYVVERSDNGTFFYPIAQVQSRNSNTTEQYNSHDNAPINKTAFYRLRIINADAKEALSKIVSVTEPELKNLTLLGNPVHNNITLIAKGEINGIYQYKINTVNGQIIQQGSLLIQNGSRYEFTLNNKALPGVYLLTLSNKSENFIYKLIIE